MARSEKRYILSTKALKALHHDLVGSSALAEAKVFSKPQNIGSGYTVLGNKQCLGVYRWLVLSLTAYLLAHWAYLNFPTGSLPDWGEAAHSALELLLPLMALFPLLVEIQRLQPLAKRHGLDISVTWCKM